MNTMFAVIGVGLWSIVLGVAAVVGTYLFLRDNPNKKAKIDSAVDKAKSRLD